METIATYLNHFVGTDVYKEIESILATVPAGTMVVIGDLTEDELVHNVCSELEFTGPETYWSPEQLFFTNTKELASGGKIILLNSTTVGSEPSSPCDFLLVPAVNH